MKPNFLVIIADQMRADCTGYGGHPDIVTPHLDALSQRAHVYTLHIAASPVCLPSRMALITGRNRGGLAKGKILYAKALCWAAGFPFPVHLLST